MNIRIAVSAEDLPQGKAIVADHFGRCSKFLIYEVNEEKKVVKEEVYYNPLEGRHGGACELPAYVKEYNANVIIAGGMGRKAVMQFNQFGIQVITAPGAEILDALHGYLNGDLNSYEECAGHQDKGCH
jgi:predicted Fe-Mo cluster-binding NifX family protein